MAIREGAMDDDRGLSHAEQIETCSTKINGPVPNENAHAEAWAFRCPLVQRD
jgi:hypothetical protein